MMKKTILFAFHFLLFAGLFCSFSASYAQESESLGTGFDFDSLMEDYKGHTLEVPTGSRGIFDFLYKHTKGSNTYNGLWWGKTFKGGGGIIKRDQGDDTKYGGLFFHPKLPYGSLTAAGHFINTGQTNQFELKAEYRLPTGIGAGAGYIDLDGAKVQFAKVSFHGRLTEKWKIATHFLVQEVDKSTSFGAYMNLSDPTKMLAAGYDGEELRLTAGFVVPKTRSPVRPAAEIFWLDRSPGQLSGSNFLLMASTLRFTGGFISHNGRLGRSMGAQGIEFINPITFLLPNWNRLLNVWEQGNMVDWRLIYVKPPNDGPHTLRTEAIVWPFQFDRILDFKDLIFVGGYYREAGETNATGAMTGIKYFFGPLGMSAQAEYDFGTKYTTVNIGFSSRF